MTLNEHFENIDEYKKFIAELCINVICGITLFKIIQKKFLFQSDFHSKTHFDRYMFELKCIYQINQFINKGYLVLNEDNEIFDKPFEIRFETKNDIKIPEFWIAPCNYFEYSITDKNKIFVERTKKQAKEFYSKFRIVNPKNIEKINVWKR